MIRILVAERLNAKTLDLLNEIPEFEINEKTGLSPAQLLAEIQNADAMIAGASLALGDDIFKQGGDLKLVVRCGQGSGPLDRQAAQRHGVEIREDAAGQETIAILKDFFNV